MLPARIEHREIRGANRKATLVQLCEAALANSNEDHPAVICTIYPREVNNILDQLLKMLPEDPQFHQAVVDVFPMTSLPGALTRRNYGFFGVYGYDDMLEKDRRRLRPDFCEAKLIVTVVGEEFEAEVPDWLSWDRQKWPEGPF